MSVRPVATILVLMLSASVPLTTLASDGSEKARLNAECEAARDQKLAPERARYVDECVAKGDRDRDGCERYYSDYGNRAGGRAPLYYDLPECVKAFEYGRGTSRH